MQILRRVAFCMIVSFLFLIYSIPADAKARSISGHRYDDCMQKPGVKLIAAASMLYTYCLYNTSETAEKIKEVVSRCNRGLPKAFRSKIRCKIVYQNRKIVDEIFAKSLDESFQFSGNLVVYDENTKKLQRSTGEIVISAFEVKSKADIGRMPVKLTTGGIILCEGYAKEKSYDLECFGKNFKGSILLDSYGTKGGILHPLPSKFRLIHQGSYIEWVK